MRKSIQLRRQREVQLSTTNYKARGRISVLSDKEMKIYTVESITEADYGCEETVYSF